MALITEEDQVPRPKHSPPTKPASSAKPKPVDQPNVFAFWFYFTLVVSLITISTIVLSSFASSDPRSWFLSLPSPLRQHYSKGRIVKVQITSGISPIEVFTFDSGKLKSEFENVLFVHGFGLSSFSFSDIVKSLGLNGVRGIAIDLPGNGFSDKSIMKVEFGELGALGKLKAVFEIIKEKGVFWAFDQIVETGQMPYEEIVSLLSERVVAKPIEFGPAETGRVLGQVIDTLSLAPLHLVLHDSSLTMVSNWVKENPKLLRSITLIDTGLSPAMPMWVLKYPVISNIVLGYKLTFEGLIKMCCSKGIDSLEVEAHRILLNGKDARRSVVGSGKMMNYSFDIAEWGSSQILKEMPIQVLWSNGWSKEWSEVGRQVSEALPQANFVSHSGGRWPQGDVADEIAQNIYRFVSSLPKSVRKADEETIPVHIHKILDEAEGNNEDQHNHDHHGHSHVHQPDYADAYGLGHGWGS